jgi:hypothetical protein
LLERATGPDTQPLAESILIRIQEIAQGRAHLAARTALKTLRHAYEQIDKVSQQQWWTPADLPTPPSSEIVTATPVKFSREDVDRVFTDL